MKQPRQVDIADHLWDAFDEMALEMGADRDALINQAMHMFARLNGYLSPGVLAAAAVPPELRTPAGPPPSDDDPRRREVAKKVLETANALEKAIHTPLPMPAYEPALTPAHEPPASAYQPVPSAFDPPPIAEPPPASAFDAGPAHAPEPAAASESPPELPIPVGESVPGMQASLYLMSENGSMEKVAKDRFVIGRGKHCDLVIDSGKVSREHAAVIREGNDYFIEDLGSSNGTWYQQARIQRRQIADGDEYYVCSEKIRCVLR